MGEYSFDSGPVPGYDEDGNELLPIYLGHADWLWDDELNCHVPCCTRSSGKGHRCHNGPLTGDAIGTGDCGEHDSLRPE